MSNFPMLGNKPLTDDEVFFDSVPLPSNGLLYSEEHPLHSCSTVDVKHMTASEENILGSPALLKNGTVLDVLIKSCLLNKLIDPGSLLIGDKTAILLAIRMSGFGPEYKVKTFCPECNFEFDHTFSLQLRIKRLGEDLPEGSSMDKIGPNLFTFTLPKSKKVIHFSLLTDAESTEIAKIQEQRSKALLKQGIKSEVSTAVTDNLVQCIKKFGEHTDKNKIADCVRKMPAMDSRALRDYINAIEPGCIMAEDVQCPKCDTVEEHPIPMGFEFFWPKK